MLRDAAVVGSARPDQRTLAIVAFEEVGVDGGREGRIVEFDRVVGAVVFRSPAPGGTDLDA